MITERSRADKSVKKLIYNESVIMFERDGTLMFEVDTDGLKYQIWVTFDAMPDKPPLSSYVWDDRPLNRLNIYLSNWDTDSWADLSEPIKIKMGDNETVYYVKLRNTSFKDHPSRKVELSIWMDINGE